MKISYISDLHLDFHVPFTKNQIKFANRTIEFVRNLVESDKGNKDVLVIAGDISHLNKQSYLCIEEFSKHYKKVLIIYGNHDYYLISKNQSNKYKNNSANRVEELTEMLRSLSSVHVFTKDSPTFIYKDVKFGGLTMWYPLKTCEQQQFFQEFSNDSKLIKGFNIEEAHEEDMETYGYLLQDDVDIMISHVPVINIDSHSKYDGTSCYFTPVKDIDVSHWIFGHSHEQKIYRKPYGNFYMNCLGYPEEELELTIKSFYL